MKKWIKNDAFQKKIFFDYSNSNDDIYQQTTNSENLSIVGVWSLFYNPFNGMMHMYHGIKGEGEKDR